MKATILLLAVLAATGLAHADQAKPQIDKAAATARKATPEEIALIRADLQNALKDADSAKFLNVKVRGKKVCGEVNAKNSFGAYIGYHWFQAFLCPASRCGSPSALVAEIDTNDLKVAQKLCSGNEWQ